MNETVDAKHQNHENLDSAIINVASALHAAETLYEKIMNTSPEDKPCEDRYNASLNSVLENGADRLHKITEEIHIALNKIDDALF